VMIADFDFVTRESRSYGVTELRGQKKSNEKFELRQLQSYASYVVTRATKNPTRNLSYKVTKLHQLRSYASYEVTKLQQREKKSNKKFELRSYEVTPVTKLPALIF
jgi:hypothetical protein